MLKKGKQKTTTEPASSVTNIYGYKWIQHETDAPTKDREKTNQVGPGPQLLTQRWEWGNLSWEDEEQEVEESWPYLTGVCTHMPLVGSIRLSYSVGLLTHLLLTSLRPHPPAYHISYPWTPLGDVEEVEYEVHLWSFWHVWVKGCISNLTVRMSSA